MIFIWSKPLCFEGACALLNKDTEVSEGEAVVSSVDKFLCSCIYL
jgi:hypothetical protein